MKCASSSTYTTDRLKSTFTSQRALATGLRRVMTISAETIAMIEAA